MTEPRQAMEILAYSELLIACQANGCSHVFQPTIDEPATDPVEDWAKRMTDLAYEAGWSVSVDGRVLCPTHRAAGKR